MIQQSQAGGAHPSFDVYGYRFRLESESAWALDGVCQDFAYFRAEDGERTEDGGRAEDGDPADAGKPAVRIEMIEAEPDYDSLPECDASVYTPRNVVYRVGQLSYIDYSGRGVAIHNPGEGFFRITSLDRNLLYESVYLFLLSQIGQFMDGKRLHRLHALAASVNGKAILVLLPMGGGKSTLCAGLLEHPEIKLLSDDSPFIDPQGRIHAFPLHLGLLPGREKEVPEEHRRHIERMEFGSKYLVNIEYFADRLAGSAEPGLVFLGHRSLSPECRIERAGPVDALRAVVANGVVGLGLFHGLEFILSASPWELVSKAALAVSRLDNCLTLLRRSETYYLRLGLDVRANAQTVVDFALRTL